MTRFWPALVLAAPLALTAAHTTGRDAASVEVQLLAITDFHGNLEPPSGAGGSVNGTPAGGAEYLATHLRNAVAQNSNSIVVSAGDQIGGSPLISSFFHDEPAIEAMNAMNLAVSAVGNHELDRGPLELLRMQGGGCYPSDGCLEGERFSGAQFRYLAANVIDTATDGLLFPATAVTTVGGVPIGFIGEVLKRATQIVRPAGTRGLRFLDEASTANLYAARLKERGVRAIVLLIHEGGQQDTSQPIVDPNGCTSFKGALRPIVSRLSPDIRVVISGHTHEFYNCVIDGRVVTNAGSNGRLITRVNLAINPVNDVIVSATATNEIVTRDVEKDAVQARLVATYRARSASVAGRVVGSLTGDLRARANHAGESALGDVIADAQLAATTAQDKGGALVAFVNPGGIRTDVVANPQMAGPASGARGQAGPVGAAVTYGDLFAVQPFRNDLSVMTLTGDLIRKLLEQQFDNPGSGEHRILQVSDGFAYDYSLNRPRGRRVDPRSIKIGGRVVESADRVRVTVNDFLAEGGDGFTVFRRGTNKVVGDLDIDALVAYFRTNSPMPPGPQNRIVRTH